MVLSLLAQEITQYLRTLDGLPHEIVKEDRYFITLRCVMCQTEFEKKISLMAYAMRHKKPLGTACSKTCKAHRRALLYPESYKAAGLKMKGIPKPGPRGAGKTRMPLSDAHRAAVSATLKAKSHRPPVRKGNGTGMTPMEAKLWPLLISLGFVWNHAVSLGAKHEKGYPFCYKLDFALPDEKVGLEVDGLSHNLISRQAQDRKKVEKLAELGWRVFRVKNSQVESLSSTSTLLDVMTIMPEEFSSIIARTLRTISPSGTSSSRP